MIRACLLAEMEVWRIAADFAPRQRRAIRWLDFGVRRRTLQVNSLDTDLLNPSAADLKPLRAELLPERAAPTPPKGNRKETCPNKEPLCFPPSSPSGRTGHPAFEPRLSTPFRRSGRLSPLCRSTKRPLVGPGRVQISSPESIHASILGASMAVSRSQPRLRLLWCRRLGRIRFAWTRKKLLSRRSPVATCSRICIWPANRGSKWTAMMTGPWG